LAQKRSSDQANRFAGPVENAARREAAFEAYPQRMNRGGKRCTKLEAVAKNSASSAGQRQNWVRRSGCGVEILSGQEENGREPRQFGIDIGHVQARRALCDAAISEFSQWVACPTPDSRCAGGPQRSLVQKRS
jgi:hypothetical protein